MASILGMMKGMLEITLINTQVPQDLYISSQILITGLLLLFPRMRRIMTMLGMTRQPGVATLHGIDLHLGQKAKLGGEARRHLAHLHIIFDRSLYIHISLSFVVLILFLFPKTQKDQKYFS